MAGDTPTAWNYPFVPRQAPQQYSLWRRILLRLAGVNPTPVIAGTDAPVADINVEPSEPTGRGMLTDLTSLDGAFSLENRDRLSRYREYDNMDTGDVASQLDAIVDAVLISDDSRAVAFKAEARGNPKINNLIQDLIERTGLQFKARQFLRDVLKYGDCPIALWFDSSDNIVATQKMHPAYMRRRRDRYGRLLGGYEKNQWPDQMAGLAIPRAYWQVSPTSNGLVGSETPIGAWLPWQMVWLKWRTDDSYNYSFGSYIEDMRRDWLKLRLMEASMVMGRTSRAYPRRVFFLDTTNQSKEAKIKTVQEFKEALGLTELRNVDSSGNIIAGVRARSPMEVDSDIFIGTGYKTGPDTKLYPQLNDVKLEDPRIAGLERIPDVEYFRGKQYRRVSPEFMGVARQSNDITQQDLASQRMFENCADILEYGLIRPICRLQAYLRGYTLDDKEFTVSLSNSTIKSSWRHADSAFRSSMAVINELSSGVASVKSIMQDEDHITEAEWEEHVAQLRIEKKLRDEGVLPPLSKTASGDQGKSGDGAQGPPNISKVAGGNRSS